MGDETHGLCEDCGKWTCEHIDAQLHEWKRRAEAAEKVVGAARSLYVSPPVDLGWRGGLLNAALCDYDAAKASDADENAGECPNCHGEARNG